MVIPEDYIKKKGRVIPFGYKLSDIEGYLQPIPNQLEVLYKYVQQVESKVFSLREAAALIEEETNRKL